MKKRLLSLVLTAVCLLGLLSAFPAFAASYPYTAIAGKDGANLRDQADINGRIVLVIHPYELVTVTGRRGDWYAVRLSDKKGYVHQNKISFFSEMVFDDPEAAMAYLPEYAGQQDGTEEEQGMIVRVGKGGANMRDVMNLEAKPIRILHAGEEVYVLYVVTVNRHDWAVVQTDDGIVGYVSAGYLDWEAEEEE